MDAREWTAHEGRGFAQGDKHYCCRACAEQRDCTCGSKQTSESDRAATERAQDNTPLNGPEGKEEGLGQDPGAITEDAPKEHRAQDDHVGPLWPNDQRLGTKPKAA